MLYSKLSVLSLLFVVLAMSLHSCKSGDSKCIRIDRTDNPMIIPPAGVKATFRVLACDGSPVRELTNNDVKVINDEKGEPFGTGMEGGGVSDIGVPTDFGLFSVLALDMSDSIFNSGSVNNVIDGALTFIKELVTDAPEGLKHKVALIAFGRPDATQEEIGQVAREAQAHEFVTSFGEGYETEVGERGVTLSGGQRQRIAIARAFLTDPRILILDDSTSAIDSATEDQIQRAMRRISSERTTFIITHRLSQIRWANRILVLRRGELVDQGTHEELMERSADYRRIFARYD